ncbi:MAG: lipoprotein signal peptidase [Gammaproteobacteria bacterium]|nr:MAG: lipoprotein signal peptidase [Gammaproteobacteria bacterium]
MTRPGWHVTRWYFVALVVIVLDQWSKQLVSSLFQYGETLSVLPFFNLTLVHNLGAAFSFLSDAGGWQRWFFTLLGFIVSLFIVFWIWKIKPPQKLLGLALALVLGGALGNVWDRLTHGYVIDFIDVYYQGYHWPAFNIADSAITCGAILLILESLLSGKDNELEDTKYE